MEQRNTIVNMHDRILRAALEIFSEKGYFAATMKDISERAECNQVTIYRHFEDKKSLFLKVVDAYHAFYFDEEALNARLSYMNLHNDLMIMGDAFFDAVFSQIAILRIFINEGPSFPEIAKVTWFIPRELTAFVADYLNAMYFHKMRPQAREIIAESFAGFVVRICLRKNMHEGYTEKSRELMRTVREEISRCADLTVDMIMKETQKK